MMHGCSLCASQERLALKYHGRVDSMMKFDLAQFSSNRWLTIRIACLGGTVVLGAGLMVLQPVLACVSDSGVSHVHPLVFVCFYRWCWCRRCLRT